MGLTEELSKLQQLYEAGALSEEEYGAAKARLLNSPPPPPETGMWGTGDQEREARMWGMILHLSMLLGYSALPIAGLLAPVIIWQLKKNELPLIDEHGRNATNWLISEFIYTVICVLLVIVGIGIPLFVVLVLLGIIFPIIAAIKANDGIAWRYPLSFTFF